MPNKWFEEFTVALVEEDVARLERLHGTMPSFSELADLQRAKALIGEALLLVRKKRLETKSAMDQVKKGAEFQKNAYSNTSRFDRSY